MAKRSSQPITAADLDAYLSSEDSFALELWVVSELRAAGIDVSHGGTYQDSVTQKYRQYDVRASRTKGDRSIQLAVECKALRKTSPILVSRVPRPANECIHEVVLSRMPGQILPGIGLEWVPGRSDRVPNDKGLYPFGGPVGRSIAQVSRNLDGDFSTSDAESFEKWNQALSSSADLVKKACMACETVPAKEFATSILPLLVVPDDTLWVVDYNQSGDRLGAPKLEDHATLYIGRQYDGPNRFTFTITHLHILTKQGAHKFFARVGSDPALWYTLFPTTQFPNLAQ